MDDAGLIRVEAGVATYGPFTATPVGLAVSRPPTYDEWARFGEFLRLMEGAVQWLVGDWLNLGEHYEEASQVIDAEHWSEETVNTYRRVAARVPAENRLLGPSFSHCQEVADLGAPDQRKWLKKAAEGEDGKPWSLRRLRAELSAATQAETYIGYMLLVEFEQPADRDIVANEHERHGRRVKRFESKCKLKETAA